jgi:hypothetical protein
MYHQNNLCSRCKNHTPDKKASCVSSGLVERVSSRLSIETIVVKCNDFIMKDSFDIGDIVTTKVGDRIRGNSWKGKILKFCKHGKFDAAVVEKDSTWTGSKTRGRKVVCLLKNLKHAYQDPI